MAKQTNSISGDEIYLRLHSPKFFKELIDSRTASLEEAGDVEGLTAWKQEREQKDQMWQDLVSASPNLSQQVVDQEALQDAVKGFAAEFAKVSPQDIDRAVLEESIQDILLHEDKAPIDRQMEANREIDAWRERELDKMSLPGKSFSEDLEKFRLDEMAARKEFIADQAGIGKDLAAEVNAPKQENTQKVTDQSIKTPAQEIDPPVQD